MYSFHHGGLIISWKGSLIPKATSSDRHRTNRVIIQSDLYSERSQSVVISKTVTCSPAVSSLGGGRYD